MRRRMQCTSNKRFGKVINLCHKILFEVFGKDMIDEDEETIIIIEPEKIIFKCPGCGSKKVIKFK